MPIDEKDSYKERIELLKAKQGLDNNLDEVIEIRTNNENLRYTKPEGWEAVKNFWYHNKFPLIVGFFLLLTFGTMFIQTITREKADIRVIFLTASEKASGSYFRVENIEQALELYTEDINKDNNIAAEIYYIDLSSNGDAQIQSANQTKFIGELRAEESQLYIIDKDAYALIADNFGMTTFFVNIEDTLSIKAEALENLTKQKTGYLLKGTPFASEARWESIDDTYFFALKSVPQDASDKAKKAQQDAQKVLENIINQNRVNGTANTSD